MSVGLIVESCDDDLSVAELRSKEPHDSFLTLDFLPIFFFNKYVRKTYPLYPVYPSTPELSFVLTFLTSIHGARSLVFLRPRELAFQTFPPKNKATVSKVPFDNPPCRPLHHRSPEKESVPRTYKARPPRPQTSSSHHLEMLQAKTRQTRLPMSPV